MYSGIHKTLPYKPKYVFTKLVKRFQQFFTNFNVKLGTEIFIIYVNEMREKF